MQPGELVVARMSGGISVGRLLEVESSRARIAVRRNKEARLPLERLVMATGIAVSGDEEVEEFRRQSEDMSSRIDMTELWEVLREEGEAFSLNDLAELYWGASPGAAQKIALLLHLERESLYFVQGKGDYTPRSQEAVQGILARRQREADHARDAEELVRILSQGRLPDELSPHQRSLLDHLKGFAVHGDNYTRSAVAKGLLNDMERKGGDLQRLSFELLVDIGVFSPDQPLELEREGIVEEFSQEALEEASRVDAAEVSREPNRKDLTGIAAVTIDDVDTEDKDDALSLEVEDAGQGDAVYRIGVHITDAGALIPQGGVLDMEADRRMATLYMPERNVPMLPPEVSNRKGSLEPGETRAALSLLARVTESGEVLDWEVAPTVVRSRAALSYEDVDTAINDAGHPWYDTLAPMHQVAQALRRRRDEAGAISLERPEMIVKVLSSGEVSVRVIPRATPARQMVAEFMVLCNSLLAEFCRREGIPTSYRSQTAPDLSDLSADLPAGGELPDGPLRWYLMMRRLPPADLSTRPAAHGGLGVSAYIQATSPLRRYPDLVMQRQISRFLRVGEPLYSTEEIASVAQRADVQLRELGRLEEERKRYWFLKYLQKSLDRAGDDDEEGLFEAVVLENHPGRSALLELTDYPFRVRAQLPNSVNPGETVTLELHGVDLWRRVGRFVHRP